MRPCTYQKELLASNHTHDSLLTRKRGRRIKVKSSCENFNQKNKKIFFLQKRQDSFENKSLPSQLKRTKKILRNETNLYTQILNPFKWLNFTFLSSHLQCIKTLMLQLNKDHFFSKLGIQNEQCISWILQHLSWKEWAVVKQKIQIRIWWKYLFLNTLRFQHIFSRKNLFHTIVCMVQWNYLNLFCDVHVFRKYFK